MELPNIRLPPHGGWGPRLHVRPSRRRNRSRNGCSDARKPKQQAKYSIDANGRREKERKNKSGGKAGSAPSAVSWMINFQAQPRSPQARRRRLRLAPPPPSAVLSDGQIKGRSKPRWQVPISFILPHLYPLMKVGVESRAESQSDASHPESQALKL